MRHTLLLLATGISFFSCSLFGMHALFHLVDKNYVAPENYITDSKSSELCEELMLLDPEKDGHKPFQLDDETLNKIHQAFEREEKLLLVGEQAICTENSYARLERVKMIHKAFISPNYEAIANGFLVAHQRRNKQTEEKLQRAQAQPLSPFTPVATATVSAQPSASGTLPLATLNDLSPQGLEDQILKSNSTYIQKAANYIRKTLISPIGYLTDQKSGTVADTVLLFNPELPNAMEFNQSLELHRELVHNAFERQNRMRYLVQYYLQNKDHNGMRILSEKAHRGYRSLLTAVVIRAFLKYAESKTKIENPQSQQIKPQPSGILTAVTAACKCIPPKLLKNCPTCLATFQQASPPPPVPPSGKNPPMNLEGQCTCAQPKILKSCPECLSKLLQQQCLVSSSAVQPTTPLLQTLAVASPSQAITIATSQTAAAASSSSSASPIIAPPVPPKPTINSDNPADNNGSN